MLQSFIEMLRNFGKLADKTEEIEKILPEMLDLETAELLPDKIGMQRVLCHGDLWSMNILWKENGKDLDLAAVIDYQTAHMGCPASDLVRVFSSCLSGKDRRRHWEELVEEFYSYLEEEVGGAEMPYTLEQLKESYRRSFPLCAFMIVPAIGPLCDLLCRNPEDEKQKKYLDTATEKTECLLEDIIYFHERNMKLRRGEETK
ncbi:hypothetical protein Y032_0306g1992 [Ancylostoma ceylanicum]|uniref:CHK kinase-like domain-containing protein n=2 Tax=Ancylostoma ceylanicum TaxID=53326 RepID=A0A016S2Y2_9BILA|nr:hypothetical protein Y032_0306g1992 [Ancylostoma ceylanicum]